MKKEIYLHLMVAISWETSNRNRINQFYSINIPFSTLNDNGERILVSNIKVFPSGIIEATYGMKTVKRIGQLALARFANPSELKSLEPIDLKKLTKVESTGGSGDEDGFGKFQAGSIESQHRCHKRINNYD